MKIYIGHANSFDYKSELYQPLKESELATQHEFIFPHETNQRFNSKKIIKNCDLMIAEVSYPATGLGIELGWANNANCPIICVYKAENEISSSLKIITNTFIPYHNSEELVNELKKYLFKYNNKTMGLQNFIKINKNKIILTSVLLFITFLVFYMFKGTIIFCNKLGGGSCGQSSLNIILEKILAILAAPVFLTSISKLFKHYYFLASILTIIIEFVYFYLISCIIFAIKQSFKKNNL